MTVASTPARELPTRSCPPTPARMATPPKATIRPAIWGGRRRSCSSPAAKAAVNKGVHALSTEVSAEVMCSSPHAIRMKGMTLMASPSTSRCPQVLRSGNGWPVDRRKASITARPSRMRPHARNVGGTPSTTTLMNRNDQPQMKASSSRRRKVSTPDRDGDPMPGGEPSVPQSARSRRPRAARPAAKRGSPPAAKRGPPPAAKRGPPPAANKSTFALTKSVGRRHDGRVPPRSNGATEVSDGTSHRPIGRPNCPDHRCLTGPRSRHRAGLCSGRRRPAAGRTARGSARGSEGRGGVARRQSDRAGRRRGRPVGGGAGGGRGAGRLRPRGRAGQQRLRARPDADAVPHRHRSGRAPPRARGEPARPVPADASAARSDAGGRLGKRDQPLQRRRRGGLPGMGRLRGVQGGARPDDQDLGQRAGGHGGSRQLRGPWRHGDGLARGGAARGRSRGAGPAGGPDRRVRVPGLARLRGHQRPAVRGSGVPGARRGAGASAGARAAPRRGAPAGDRPGHRSRPALPLLRPPATAGAWGPAGRQRLAHAAGEPDRLDGDGRAAGAAPGRPRRRALGRVGAGRARAGRPGAGPHRRPPAGSGTGPWRAPDLRRRSGGAGARPARGGAGDGVGLFRSLLRSAAGGAAPGRAAGALRLRAGALGPAPLPDAVRGRPGIGRDAERRPALHGPDAARAARPRRGARHHQPARRAVHLRRPRGRPALRAGRAVPRPRGDRRRRGPMPRRRRASDRDRHHRGPDAGDRRRPQRAGATGRRRHPAPHRPRPPAPRRRRPADRPPRARGQPPRPAAGVPVVRDAAGRLRRGLARGLPLARVRRRLPDRAADQESVTVAHLGCVTVAGLASNAKARRRRRRAAAGPSNLSRPWSSASARLSRPVRMSRSAEDPLRARRPVRPGRLDELEAAVLDHRGERLGPDPDRVALIGTGGDLRTEERPESQQHRRGRGDLPPLAIQQRDPPTAEIEEDGFELPATLGELVDGSGSRRRERRLHRSPTTSRARAIGMWGATTGVGIALGPIVGGWLLERFWWGSVFVFMAPVAAGIATLAWLVVPPSRDPTTPPVDWAGLVLSAIGLGALVFAIIQAPEAGWGSARTIASFAASVVVLAGFVVVERRRRHPMVDVGLFRNPRFTAASGAVTVAFFALSGFIFLVTQYFQFLKAYSPLGTGVRLLPVATSVAVASLVGTRLAVRVGNKQVVTAGLVLLCAAFGWIATTSAATSYFV